LSDHPYPEPSSAQAANAAVFIAANLQTFGLLGDNNLLAPDRRDEASGIAREFTLGNHFKFGFDGIAFNDRRLAASRYWVEYGAPSREHEGFQREFRRAIAQIHANYGTFSVTSTKSYIASTVAREARDMELDFKLIAIDIEGFNPVRIEDAARTERHSVSWERFCEFALNFSRAGGCSDPWIALEAFHGELSQVPHIYDGAELRLINNNFDTATKVAVGPLDWALVDNEKFTAINRYLLAENKPGIPQILRWSPELIAAQLDSPAYRDWLKRAQHASAASADIRVNKTARMQLMTDSYPGLQVTATFSNDRRDPRLKEQMKLLRRRMRNSAPGRRMQHRYPLSRLAALLGIAIEPRLLAKLDLYGGVHGN